MARRFGPAPALVGVAVALSLGGCGYSRYGYSTLSERECLARAMYFESNRSSEEGMIAVGTVVMNRLQSPRYPKTICEVVGQRNQFASGVLSKPVNGRGWGLALQSADAVLAGARHNPVGGAMFFHTAGYTFPYRNMAYVAAAGGNVFYEKRTPGTFTPIHPATLVASAEPVRPRPEPRRYAEVRPERQPEPRRHPELRRHREAVDEEPLARAAPPRRPAPEPRREPDRVVAALASVERNPDRARSKMPTIAELIEMDLERPKRR